MTELSFLIDLLLNHDLPKVTKDLVAQRIKEVEERITAGPPERTVRPAQALPPQTLYQVPSTLAIMAKHGDVPHVTPIEIPPPEPVAVIAQTAATAAALQARNESISAALSGRVDKVAGKPRKW